MTHAALKKKRAETRLPPEEDPEFQIAPMIDILLVLLVFFMSISSTEVLQTREDITLPVAKDAKEKGKDDTKQGQVIINVIWNDLAPGREGTIDVDGKTYANAAEIAGILKTKVDQQPQVRILIRADRKVRYEYLRNLLRTAGGAGVQNVTFSVTDKESGGPATP